MNIVLVNPEYQSRSGQDHGGIATYIYSMANALALLGHSIHIIAKAKSTPDTLHANVTFHTIQHTPLPRLFPWIDKITHNETIWERGYSLAAKIEILKIHAQTPVDIVEFADYGGMAYEFRQPLPFPLVIHFHTPSVIIDFYNNKKTSLHQKQWYAFEAKALSRAQGFRSPSVSLKQEACKYYGLKDDQIQVISHPIDTTPFDVIKRHEKNNSTIDILFTGRLERRKGGELIANAIDRILDLDPRIRITIAGELDMGDAGNYRNIIERTLSEEQRHRVWLLGPSKRRNLPVLYCQSDIFIIPSLFENAPYALLEAMSARIPVIGANTSGIAEIIKNNVNGILFNLDSLESLTTSIMYLIKNPQKALDFSAQAYKDIHEKYKPENIANTSLAFFASVIETFRKKTKTHL